MKINKSKNLKIPTRELIEKYIDKFNKKPTYLDDDKAIDTLVKTFPKNDKIEEIILKVYIINFIYKTRIFKPYYVAKNILEKRIDGKLMNGDSSVVDDIATGHKIMVKTGKTKKKKN
jgi:hypothetical protein